MPPLDARDHLMLDTARRMLDPYRRTHANLETVIFGVPLSWLDRSDLEAAIEMLSCLGYQQYRRHASDMANL